ncbi:MAG: hypothetical protein K0S76_2194 [Herbinix sp.]|nr:hypothetical protein [Herbinix sp.]
MLKTIGRIITETAHAIKEAVTNSIKFIIEFTREVMKELFDSDICKYHSISDYSKQEQAYLNQIITLMERHFPDGRIGESLATLEPVDRAGVVSEFTRELLDMLQLQNVKVEISYELPATTMGCYYFSEEKIEINGAYLAALDPVVLREVIDTVIHETRHAMQLKALSGDNVYGFTDQQLKEWIFNLEHPIDGKRNFYAYRTQAIEVEAFDYASVTIKEFEGRIKA